VGKKLELAIAILNGAIGDHLARTGNGLATEMTFVRDGQPIAHVEPSDRFVVLVHGLMCTEDVWLFRDGTDYGARLESDFGYTPLYVRYNSGRTIAENGRALATLLASLPPAKEILLVGYSMGGLIVRSACHLASIEHQPWLASVKRAFYLATPHRGAPMERAGRVVSAFLARVPDPTAELVAQLAELRSAGIKDLGDERHPVAMLPSIRHYLIAGSLRAERWLTELFGDTMVMVSSGTDGHYAGPRALPPSHVKVMPGLSHMDLAHHPDVYRQLHEWLEEDAVFR
jgi:triacylglycerol lipase